MRVYKKGRDNPNFVDRVGERHVMDDGNEVEIIECFDATNCTLRYQDGTLLYKKSYSQICGKTLRKPNGRAGHKYINHQGYEVEVLESLDYHKSTVKFNDERATVLYNVSYGNVEKGTISNPYHPTLYDNGYIGVGKYTGKLLDENRHVYKKWQQVITRGCSKSFKEKSPSYKDVTVCKEWKCLQDFGMWYENNCKPHMQEWELDKDILIKGNKVYSPETCCFVPHEINSLFLKSDSVRGDYPIGVSKSKKRFRATLNRKGFAPHLGTFDTPEEAFDCYKFHKEAYIKQIADEWEDQIEPEVYEAMYAYQVEITD